MVLLAAAICTKAGKAIISRQFVEMSRSRVEGLLGAFPKLMNTGKEHTFVETESVRYVYQPLDTLYMLLITTKASNILEDLETLRLFSRVIPEYCRSMDEPEVIDKSFQLIFAFDEIVALGYRENVNLAQIRTFTEMDSHEEKVFQAVRKTQEQEAHEEMKRKQKELQAARLAIAKGKAPRSSMTGFGGNTKPDYNQAIEITPEPTVPKPSKPVRPSGSNKAMKLGSKNKDVDHFVDKLRSEGADITSPTGKRAPAAKPSQTAAPTSAVHIKIDEKITLTAGRDGGLEQMEVRGLVLLRISDAEYGKISIAVENNDNHGFQLQTHPNVDKKMFNQNSVLCLKQSGKAFPLNADIGVLKWRLQSTDESIMPLTINCWPSENDGQCDVNIEYELQQEEIELKDVVITIPVPHGVGAPVVGEIEGDYRYDHKRSILEWQLPVIDESNKTGAMEFSISAHPEDFFPINVSFGSSKSFCDITIKDVNIVEDGMPVKFSSEVMFSVDKYEIV